MSVVSRIPLLATTLESTYQVTYPAASPVRTVLPLQTINVPRNSVGFIVRIKNLSANALQMLPEVRLNGTLLPDCQFTQTNRTQFSKEDIDINIHEIVKGGDVIILQVTNGAITGAADTAIASILWWFMDWRTFENFQDDPEILPFYKLIKDKKINNQFVI